MDRYSFVPGGSNIAVRFYISRSKYVLLNASAAFLVSIYSLHTLSLQPVFINIAWTILSLVGLKVMADSAKGKTGWLSGSALATDKASLLIIGAGIAVFAAAFPAMNMNMVLWLSWLSLWLYSATYFCFIFFKLSDGWFFLLCILSASVIIPQLVIDNNQPVLGVQAMWIFWSGVGAIRLFLNRRNATLRGAAIDSCY